MASNQFEANLAAFQGRFGDKAIEALQQDTDDRFTLEESHSGLPLLSVIASSGLKQYLQSRVNPRAEAEKLVRETVSFDDSLSVVCVVGFELGYSTEFLQAELPEQTSILVWEPHKSAFLRALESRCLIKVLADKRIFLFVDESPVKAAQVFETFLNPVKVRHWSLVVGRGTHQLDPKRVGDFYKELYSLTSARKLLFDTTIRHSSTFIKNAFSNLCHSDRALTVESLRDSHKDIPTIVVSAGPSLTRAIPTLKEVSTRSIIVAAGAAWKTLVNEGIRPNYVVLLDPFERTRSEFEGIEPDGETLVADFSGLPDVVSTFKGPIAFYCSSPELHGVMNAVTNRTWGYLDQGGSVAHIAFSFARLIGAVPVVLIGQDLAFTGGLTHVGTHVDSQQVSGRFSPKHGPLHEVEAFGGEGTVLTSRSLDTFRLWFETVATEGVLNATGGGARIRGVSEIDYTELRELSYRHGNCFLPSAEAARREPSEVAHKDISIELKALERKARVAIKDIDKAIKLLEQMHLAQAHLQNNLKLEFNTLTGKLSKLGPALSGILDYLAREQIFNTNRAYNTRLGSTGDDQVRVNLEFYRGLKQSCTRAVELLDSARHSLLQAKKG